MTWHRAELVCSEMVLRKEWEFDRPEQCRQHHHRRIEISSGAKARVLRGEGAIGDENLSLGSSQEEAEWPVLLQTTLERSF